MRIVAISGPIGAGKTTLATDLARELSAALVRTRSVLARESMDAGRIDLQALGRHFDVSTGGAWVADAVRAQRGEPPWTIVDAVRIEAQVAALRKLAPTFHVHLTARQDVLHKRYDEKETESRDYARVIADRTEIEVVELAGKADVVVDTSALDVGQVREVTLGALASFAALPHRTA
jgi:adenylosuccinate synthase